MDDLKVKELLLLALGIFSEDLAENEINWHNNFSEIKVSEDHFYFGKLADEIYNKIYLELKAGKQNG